MIIYYRVQKEQFICVVKQLIEVFPTIDKNYWYRPHRVDVLSNEVATSGCLYYGYKKKRNDLRDAGYLSENQRKEDFSDQSNENDGIANKILLVTSIIIDFLNLFVCF